MQRNGIRGLRQPLNYQRLRACSWIPLALHPGYASQSTPSSSQQVWRADNAIAAGLSDQVLAIRHVALPGFQTLLPAVRCQLPARRCWIAGSAHGCGSAQHILQPIRGEQSLRPGEQCRLVGLGQALQDVWRQRAEFQLQLARQ